MKNEMHTNDMGMTAGSAKESGPERVNAFSDGIFAIIITIMILDLKKPEAPTFAALAQQWPTWISYLVSYLFIAIVWTNHHFLSKHMHSVTPGLIWANFGHMFAVGLIPFLTSWMAETRLAPLPVAMYAFVFLLVNLTYLALIYQTLCKYSGTTASERTRQLVHLRSVTTIGAFITATIISFWLPYLGFLIITLCLTLYLKPEGALMPRTSITKNKTHASTILAEFV
ncbi:TMEM175 family protein [Puia sp. P3]|uniref:TMEM175 family protein n=1 Tax=Puia sp. P3 TaxID=3423952 RepID=UPI003D67ACEE